MHRDNDTSTEMSIYSAYLISLEENVDKLSDIELRSGIDTFQNELSKRGENK